MSSRLLSVGGRAAHAAWYTHALSLSSRRISTSALFTTRVLVAAAETSSGAGASFGRGRGPARTSMTRSASTSASSSAPTPPPSHTNITNDGMLGPETRRAMRDDTIVIEEIFRHIPQEGAVAVTSVYARLSPEVQEALSEKHGGLLPFLRARQQVFMVKENPEDGKLYLAGNPVAARRYHVRSLQKNTVRQLMGLDEGQTSGGRPRGAGYGSSPRWQTGGYRGGERNKGNESGSRGRDGPRTSAPRAFPQRDAPAGRAMRANSNGPAANSPRRQQFGV